MGVQKQMRRIERRSRSFLGSVGLGDEVGINSLSKVVSWDRSYTQKARTESDKQTKRENVGIVA